MDQHSTMVDAAVPIAVTATEWVVRYKPLTVTVAVLKIRWTAAVSGAEVFACCIRSSLPLGARLRMCGEAPLLRAAGLRARGRSKKLEAATARETVAGDTMG
jgi:hypothetical protein